jgi:hypothetical protein
VSIWNSPWCHAWKAVYDDLIIQQLVFSYPATPKDLWIPGEKRWTRELTDNLFLQNTATSIKNAMILPYDHQDILLEANPKWKMQCQICI